MAGLRAPKAGSSRDAQAKVDASFDPEDAKKILHWIKAVTGAQFPIEENSDRYKVMENFYRTLKNGRLLCYLVNAFLPDHLKLDLNSRTFHEAKNMAFETARERERIELFIVKIQEFGVHEQDTFQTDCLYERTNLNKVIGCIRVFGMEVESHPSYTGQRVWPRKSEANPRNFSEEQLKAGQNVISLQYGTNKGASQAGMTFGKKRMILQDE
ncbi:myophilin-like [Babylonia areolata]|uniref:myophilin-like n=1 Tax=Babylonia areolata TaxID=304850 RepID=UPI003FD03A32